MKLGCSKDCDDICPKEERKVIVQTMYRYSCEQCHKFDFAEASTARAERLHDRLRAIERDQSQSVEIRLALMRRLRRHEDQDEAMREEMRAAQAEEIQRAVDWTDNYGRASYLVWQEKEQGRQSTLFDPDSTATPDSDDWDLELIFRRVELLRESRQMDLIVIEDALRETPALREEYQQTMRTLREASLLRASEQAAREALVEAVELAANEPPDDNEIELPPLRP